MMELWHVADGQRIGKNWDCAGARRFACAAKLATSETVRGFPQQAVRPAGVKKDEGASRMIVGLRVIRGSLVGALEALSNDLYWDENGDWSAATSAKVRTI